MPGSWELRRKADLVVGILHVWNMAPDFFLGWQRLDKAGLLIHYDFEHDKPYDFGRNQVAQTCLDTGADHVLFIDSDIIPPIDGLRRLIAHKLPIVGGLYYRRHPAIFPEAFTLVQGERILSVDLKGEKTYEGQYKPLEAKDIHPGLNEVDGIGAGFLLIERRVLESLAGEVPLLETPGPPESRLKLHEFFRWSTFSPPWTSEDLYFCHLAKKKGWPIYVDEEVSCGHILSTAMIKNNQWDWTPLEVPK